MKAEGGQCAGHAVHCCRSPLGLPSTVGAMQNQRDLNKALSRSGLDDTSSMPVAFLTRKDSRARVQEWCQVGKLAQYPRR